MFKYELSSVVDVKINQTILQSNIQNDSINNPILWGNTNNQHSTVFRYTDLFSMHVSFIICWVMNLNMPLSKHSHDVTTLLDCEGEDVDCTVHVREIFPTKDIFPAFSVYGIYSGSCNDLFKNIIYFIV